MGAITFVEDSPSVARRAKSRAARGRSAQQATSRSEASARDASGSEASAREASSVSVVTVRGAPPLEPPYDDETGIDNPPLGMEMLPVDWAHRVDERVSADGRSNRAFADTSTTGSPTADTSTAGPSTAGPSTGERSTAGPSTAGPSTAGPSTANSGRPGQTRGSASGHYATRRFIALCMEALNGFRPIGHLRPLADQRRFADIEDQLARRSVRVRAGAPGTTMSRQQIRVRRTVLCEPLDGVVEAATVLDQGDLVWAMALRLERRPEGWICTLVRVI